MSCNLKKPRKVRQKTRKKIGGGSCPPGKCTFFGVVNVRILGVVNVLLANDSQSLIGQKYHQNKMDFDAHLFQCFSALKLEKEYSREKAVVDKVSPLEEYEEEYEDLTEGEDMSEEGSDERSGLDIYKSVIRTLPVTRVSNRYAEVQV